MKTIPSEVISVAVLLISSASFNMDNRLNEAGDKVLQ